MAPPTPTFTPDAPAAWIPVPKRNKKARSNEIGHLLLGKKHTSSGIMRALWGKAEYREMTQLWLGFDPGKRLALRQALPAREERLVGLK